MTDLISREAAIAAALATMAEAKSFGIPQMAMGASKVADDLRALPAQAPAVKKLVWIFPTWGPEVAQTPWGRYAVNRWRDGWVWCWNGDSNFVDTEEAAKAAAQADYESRILAALDLAEGSDS